MIDLRGPYSRNQEKAYMGLRTAGKGDSKGQGHG